MRLLVVADPPISPFDPLARLHMRYSGFPDYTRLTGNGVAILTTPLRGVSFRHPPCLGFRFVFPLKGCR